MKRILLVLIACLGVACGPDVDRDVSTLGDAASALTRWRAPDCTPRIARTQPHYCDSFYANAATACVRTASENFDGSGWKCLMTGCLEGYGDCDGLASNGCEAPLQTVANCGACGNVCLGVENGTPQCAAETCVIVCDPGFELQAGECVPTTEVECTAHADCDDGKQCTSDTCTLGVCVYKPIPNCSSCEVDSDCASTQFCSYGSCKGKFGAGGGCDRDAVCISGNCDPATHRCL